jgi:hypothetical protein
MAPLPLSRPDPCPSRLVDALDPVGLDAAEALQDRQDHKYVIGLERFAALVERLRETHAVLEIDGRRAFAYDTTYFDTAALRTFRDHRQQRRRRFKCRSREYVDSGLCTFEVKLKGTRGQTVKHRIACERELRDELSAPALAFLRETLEGAYGWAPSDELRPVLRVACTRVTLVAPGERVTCDFGLRFHAPAGAGGRMAGDSIIVETKSARGRAAADRELLALGARPEPACSKYCLGVALTHPGVSSNWLRPLLRQHFEAVRNLSSAPHGRRIAAGHLG